MNKKETEGGVWKKIIDLLASMMSTGEEPKKTRPTLVPKSRVNKLQLDLERVYFTADSTIGRLSIDGEFECWILEDEDKLAKNKEKKHGDTAIPRGTYTIRITYSPRFKRKLPLLLDVPGFSGIRIHAGNTAKDTEGCLLPGATRFEDSIGQSKRAFNKLYAKLERAEQDGKQIIIRITP